MESTSLYKSPEATRRKGTFTYYTGSGNPLQSFPGGFSIGVMLHEYLTGPIGGHSIYHLI